MLGGGAQAREETPEINHEAEEAFSREKRPGEHGRGGRGTARRVQSPISAYVGPAAGELGTEVGPGRGGGPTHTSGRDKGSWRQSKGQVGKAQAPGSGGWPLSCG